jgi:hypothetical protein
MKRICICRYGSCILGGFIRSCFLSKFLSSNERGVLKIVWRPTEVPNEYTASACANGKDSFLSHHIEAEPFHLNKAACAKVPN